MPWPLVAVESLRQASRYSLVGGPFGSNLTSRDYVDEGVPVIRGANLPDDREFLDDDFVFVSEEKADQLAANLAYSGDVVFTQRGTLGQVGLIPQNPKYTRYVLSQSQMKLTVDRSKVEPRFVYHYFRQPETVQYIRNHDSSSGVPHINLAVLKAMRMPLPPVHVQQRIVDCIAAYDNLIGNNRRRIKLLEESARLLFDEWLVRLRFPGHLQADNLDGVPEGWQRLPLEQVLVLQRGFDLPIQDREDGPVPIYGATGINGFHNQVKVPGPGIVTGRAGSLGVVHFVPGDFWPLNTSLWVKELRRASPRFAVHLLRAMKLDRYGQGATMPMLDRKVVHQVPVLLPAPDLMARFESFATDVYDQIDTLQRQNQQLTKARDLLLPRLMSGQLTV